MIEQARYPPRPNPNKKGPSFCGPDRSGYHPASPRHISIQHNYGPSLSLSLSTNFTFLLHPFITPVPISIIVASLEKMSNKVRPPTAQEQEKATPNVQQDPTRVF